VTVDVVSSAGLHYMFTWTGVRSGDQLLFPSDVRYVSAETPVDVELTIPALTGASSYDGHVECDYSGMHDLIGPGPQSFTMFCNPAAKAVQALIRGSTPQGDYFAASQVTSIVTSGPTTITMDAWQPAITNITTIHGDATAFEYAHANFRWGELAAAGIGSRYQSTGTPMATATMIGPTSLPNISGDERFMLVKPKSHAVALRRPYTAPSTTTELTLDTDFLPSVAATVDASLPRPVVSWVAERPITDIDVVIVQLTFDQFVGWSIASDGTSSMVTFPELPPDLLPTGPASLRALNIVVSGEFAGYDAVRPDPHAVWRSREFRVTSNGIPFSGTY